MHPIALPVVHGRVVREHFRAPIWAARAKRRRFTLGDLDDLAEHFRRRSLVEATLQADFANRLEHAHAPEPGRLARVLRHVEADSNVTLRPEIVDLLRLHLAY